MQTVQNIKQNFMNIAVKKLFLISHIRNLTSLLNEQAAEIGFT